MFNSEIPAYIELLTGTKRLMGHAVIQIIEPKAPIETPYLKQMGNFPQQAGIHHGYFGFRETTESHRHSSGTPPLNIERRLHNILLNKFRHDCSYIGVDRKLLG